MRPARNLHRRDGRGRRVKFFGLCASSRLCGVISGSVFDRTDAALFTPQRREETQSRTLRTLRPFPALRRTPDGWRNLDSEDFRRTDRRSVFQPERSPTGGRASDPENTRPRRLLMPAGNGGVSETCSRRRVESGSEKTFRSSRFSQLRPEENRGRRPRLQENLSKPKTALSRRHVSGTSDRAGPITV